MNRRSFVLRSSLAAAGLHLRALAQSPQSIEVKTPLGQLRGTTENGVHIFRGVPFATPPIGPLRFRAPEPARPWTGVRDALHFAPEAPQPGSGDTPQSEDCLYLNLWAPATGGPHPVFVWIHGGGFTGGRSFDPQFDGTQFAQAGIVCITVAYRLGVFGFLDLGPILGAAYSGGANHALADLLTALTWTQQNISAFGGDPHRVTVGGESAGAKLTGLLMGTPAARPLFAQMISESGGAERYYPAPQSADVAKGFLKQWTSTGQPTAAILTAPAADLIAAQESFTRTWPAHFPLRAELGTLLPQPPLDTIRAGATRGKRLLIGTNRDESALFIGPNPTDDPGAAQLGNLPLDTFSQIEARYAALYPDMPPALRRIRALTAEEYWIPSTRVTEAHIHGGGTAYSYRLDLPDPAGRFHGLTPHAFDIRFVWDHFNKNEHPTPTEQQLATTMHTAWANFILTGTPKAPQLPAWPPYTLPTRQTMLLNTQSQITQDPQGPERQLWNNLLEH